MGSDQVAEFLNQKRIRHIQGEEGSFSSSEDDSDEAEDLGDPSDFLLQAPTPNSTKPEKSKPYVRHESTNSVSPTQSMLTTPGPVQPQPPKLLLKCDNLPPRKRGRPKGSKNKKSSPV